MANPITLSPTGRADHLGEAIALLDTIDGLPFGRVSDALDKLSTLLVRAKAERDAALSAAAGGAK